MKKQTASLKSLFARCRNVKVFVVGDAMLDRYWMGQVDRISPEAPVPVVNVLHKQSRPGGAANVALNCRAMGAEVSLLTVCGNDAEGQELCRLLEEAGINTKGVISSSKRRTTTKTRVLARYQQVLRLDEESTEDMDIALEHAFIDTCLKAIQIEKPDILIFEDYNKGVLKENVIHRILDHCKHVGVMTAVDPKKQHFFTYRGVDLFKPNLKEVREALHLSVLSLTASHLKEIHKALHQQLQHRVTMITLSEAGLFAQEGKTVCRIPAHLRHIADVSGAGDTVIAVAAIMLFLSGDLDLSARLANLAGGLVCEEVGVVPVDSKKIYTEALALLPS